MKRINTHKREYYRKDTSAEVSIFRQDLKNIAFPKGNKLFSGDFLLIWMKQTLIWFNLQRDGTENGLSNIKDTFAESLQLQMSVLHQSMCIFKAGLSSSYDCWAKYKEKVPDVSDPNQNVETTCNSKLKFT